MPQLDCTLDASQMAPNIPSPSFQLDLTPKEIARLIFALDHTIGCMGDVLPDTDIQRYEDLMYRLGGLPDACIQAHAEGRRHDCAQG